MSRQGPVVFVHGNPENPAVWGPLQAELGRDDVVCLSPPGFGAPLVSGFAATMTGYRDWLIDRLEAFAEPVDLVGHDWGGAHTVNVAMNRPDLLRSWVSDAVGLFDPDYVWHPLARTWQTPGDGERAVEAMTTAPLARRVETMLGLGIGETVAERLAAGLDADMGRAILSLYRSADQPAMAQAGRHIDAAKARPGLAISPAADDMTGSERTRRRVAERAGADVAVLDGLGHWWMVQDPRRGARVLTDFWSQLP